MDRNEYRKLLRDPRWQKRRLELMQAARWICQCCCRGDRELQIHHLEYRDGAKPWDYTDLDLEVLCVKCHEEREAWNRVFGRSLQSTASVVATRECVRQWMKFRADESPEVLFSVALRYAEICHEAGVTNIETDEELVRAMDRSAHREWCRRALGIEGD